MIERIAQAESEAAQLKKDAAAKARELVNQAAAKAGEDVARARENARAAIDDARAEAEREGEALSCGIIEKSAAEADKACDAARANMDKAVALILERVAGA